jgi:hypothetical protein
MTAFWNQTNQAFPVGLMTMKYASVVPKKLYPIMVVTFVHTL